MSSTPDLGVPSIYNGPWMGWLAAKCGDADPRAVALFLTLLATPGLGCGRVGFTLLSRDVEGRLSDGGQATGYGVGSRDGGTGFDGGSEPACTTACANEHGSADCDTGSCVIACAIGFADCDGDFGNGCEADIAGNVATCGRCGLACSNDNGATTCSDGICAPTCEAGYADCDDDPNNGCESSLSTTSSCGACGAACANDHGITTCQSGMCEPICDTGFSDCDGDRNNGCETDRMNDPNHCGVCGLACASHQICSSGTCMISSCGTGLGECDGDPGQACETSLDTSLDHCGFCGNTCAVERGAPRCESGMCIVQSCQSGFGDCDGMAATGCEAQLDSSSQHCGGCDQPCSNDNGTTRCANSACVPTCSAGYGDCDTSRANGCEAALDTVDNCGTCGNACPSNGGTPVCNAGVCETQCDLTGTFALKLSASGSWPTTPGIAGDSGTFHVWTKVELTQFGTTLMAYATPCGFLIPPFDSLLSSDVMFFGYPLTLFDGGYLPAAETTAAVSDPSPAASLNWPLTALQMGIDMPNPTTDAWPNSASAVASGMRVDMDDHGKPGVTAVYANGGGYIYPRTSIPADDRADRSYVATRVVFSLNGSLTGCSSSSGSASVAHLDVRIFGCRVANDGRDCSSEEGAFLDEYAPAYTMDDGSHALQRLADAADCDAVRASLP